jgi:uncharacterized protein YcbX
MAQFLGRVGQLYRYPVKSMAGEAIDSADLTPGGVPGDRQFAVRDLGSGKILSAKQPAVGRLLLACSARMEADGSVTLTVGESELSSNDRQRVDRQLTEYLGRRASLVSVPAADEVYESYWPAIEGVALSDVSIDLPMAMSTHKGAFVDFAALHVLTSSSLTYLRSITPESQIDIARFRPNVMVDLADDVDAFVENEWVELTARLGRAVVRFSATAARCVMTTLAQPGVPEDRGVLQTLARTNRRDFAGFGDFACFGAYAEVVEPGEVRIGDEVSVNVTS